MEQEVQHSLKKLQKNKILLYPTDTVWGIGCDATSETAVTKVFKIKQRVESKALIILVNNVEMLLQYIPEIESKVLKFIQHTNKPTTIIYKNPVGLAKNLIAKDNTVAIRMVKHHFCEDLIKKFGKPIVSTSANISGKPTPKCFKEIENSILDSVDYIVNLHREEINTKSSTIIKIGDNEELIVLRE